MFRWLSTFTLFVILFSYSPDLSAKIIQKIVLKNGSKIVGRIILMDENIIKLQTLDKLLTIQRDKIRSISFINIPTIGRHRRRHRHPAKPKNKVSLELKKTSQPPLPRILLHPTLKNEKTQTNRKVARKSFKEDPIDEDDFSVTRSKNEISSSHPSKQLIREKQKQSQKTPKTRGKAIIGQREEKKTRTRGKNTNYRRKIFKHKRRYVFRRRKFHRYKWINPKRGLLVSGMIVFSVGYFLTAISSTIFINQQEYAFGYITLFPVIGPGIGFLGALDNNNLGPMSLILGLSFIAQVLGSTFIWIGLKTKLKRLRISYNLSPTSQHFQFAVTPMVGKDQLGLGLVGRW